MAYDPYNPNTRLQLPGQLAGSNSAIGRLMSRAQNAQYGPMRQFAAMAQSAQKAANVHAFDAVGKAHGEELAGTPGFLAAQSMAGPGSLARLRAKQLRGGVSRLASGVHEIGAESVRAQRDFTGQILGKREDERIQKEKEKRQKKGGGLGGALKRLGGAAVGFATGGVPGAIAGATGLSIPGGGGSGAAYPSGTPWDPLSY